MPRTEQLLLAVRAEAAVVAESRQHTGAKAHGARPVTLFRQFAGRGAP
jgi:hypothetical protein